MRDSVVCRRRVLSPSRIDVVNSDYDNYSLGVVSSKDGLTGPVSLIYYDGTTLNSAYGLSVGNDSSDNVDVLYLYQGGGADGRLLLMDRGLGAHTLSSSTTLQDVYSRPTGTITEPSSGTGRYASFDLDLSSLAVTAAAGTSEFYAMRINGVADADAGKSYSLLLDQNGKLGVGNILEWLSSAGNILSAANYECGLDQTIPFKSLACNVITGASYLLKINGADEYAYSSTQLDLYNNNLVNVGAAGTDFENGEVTIGPAASADGGAVVTINPPSNTAITVNTPAISVSASTQTLNSGQTIANSHTVDLVSRTYQGVAGGGTETLQNAYTLRLNSVLAGANITAQNIGALFVETGSAKFSGGMLYGIVTTFANVYNVLASDYIIHSTRSSIGTQTINLPICGTINSGRFLYVKDAAGMAATNNITLDGNASETIDGATTLVMSTNYQSVSIYCNGTSWFIL